MLNCQSCAFCAENCDLTTRGQVFVINRRVSKNSQLSLWSHCIRIWPIFYTGVHCRHREKKHMRLNMWKRSQWCRAALTCTEMFRRLTVETKSFCFFPSVYASVSCSFALNTSLTCLHL
jgi:hypothetical protein